MERILYYILESAENFPYYSIIDEEI